MYVCMYIPERFYFHFVVKWIQKPKPQRKFYHLDAQEVLQSRLQRAISYTYANHNVKLTLSTVFPSSWI